MADKIKLKDEWLDGAKIFAFPRWADIDKWIDASCPKADHFRAYSELARDWVDQNLAGDGDTATLRPEIEIGTLDTRLRLAPCQRVEPYLPRGSRLALSPIQPVVVGAEGRFTLGLRTQSSSACRSSCSCSSSQVSSSCCACWRSWSGVRADSAIR